MIEVCSLKSINALTGAKRRLALKKNGKTMRPRENATLKTATTLSTRTVGIDLGDQTSCYCILDGSGRGCFGGNGANEIDHNTDQESEEP
jgi:hypothetical protein